MQKIDTTPTARSAYELSFTCAEVETTTGKTVLRCVQLHDKGERSFSFDCEPTTGALLWSSVSPVFIERLPEMFRLGIFEHSNAGPRLRSLGEGPRSRARMWADIVGRDWPSWCECGDATAADLAEYEVYDKATGRYTGGHGFACKRCRKLWQMG